MSSKPQILIIPGSYIAAPSYQPLADIISTNHPTLSPPLIYDLPSASSGPPNPAPTLPDDASFFASKITQLADQGLDIILVAHSYGGLVAREALKGLSKAEREMKGRPGGVIHVVHISPVVCEVGQSTVDLIKGIEYDHIELVDESYARHILPRAAARVYSDLPDPLALHHATLGTTQSIPCFLDPATQLSSYDLSIPVTFVLCTEDKMFDVEFQRGRVELLRREGTDVRVVEVVAGHCPHVSVPGVIAGVVGEVVAGYT